MIKLAKLGALALVAVVFVYGLSVWLIFGLVFLMGACSMLGVQ